jgi:hypothetical protein
MKRAALLLTTLVLGLGCGNVDPFPGTYAGMWTTSLDVTTPPLGTSNTTQSVTATFTAGASGMDSATIVNLGSSGSTCALTGQDTGDAFTFTPGQSCDFPGATATYTLTVVSGSAALSGTLLSATIQWNLSGSNGVMGTAQGSFTGSRM